MQDDTFLRQKAYQIIRTKLLEGELRAGNLVSEQALAQEIGMSRTPVREAIGQLQREGLFYKVPRVGTIVRLPDNQELGELYEVREALEGYSATVAARVLTDADLEDMSRLHQELYAIEADLLASDGPMSEDLVRRYFSADIGFHLHIIRATGNNHIQQIISEFRVVQRVFEYDRMIHGLPIIQRAALQHGEILAALKQRDGDAARLAVAEHIRASRESALAGAEDKELATA